MAPVSSATTDLSITHAEKIHVTWVEDERGGVLPGDRGQLSNNNLFEGEEPDQLRSRDRWSVCNENKS